MIALEVAKRCKVLAPQSERGDHLEERNRIDLRYLTRLFINKNLLPKVFPTENVLMKNQLHTIRTY